MFTFPYIYYNSYFPNREHIENDYQTWRCYFVSGINKKMKTLYLFLDPSDYAIPQVVWADDLKDGIDVFYKAYFGKAYPWKEFTEKCAKHEVYTLKPLSFLGVFEDLI